MRRYRRLTVINRLFPFLSAGIALAALGALLASQALVQSDQHGLSGELSQLRDSIAALTSESKAARPTETDTSSTALAALTARIDQLEARLQQQALAPATTSAAAPADGSTPAATSGEGAAPATYADMADGPTKDCIPVGTRFMVTPRETYPICRSKVVVKVGDITDDTVEVAGAGPVLETGFGNLPGTKCTVMVFSADISGFGEVRVNCT